MSIITVAKSGNADYTTIKKAIENARPRDKITVHPGLYKESLIIDKPLEISGGGAAEETVIESYYIPCILMKTDSAKVSGFSLRKLVGEKDKQYPAVDISQGDLVLEDCDITSKSSDSISIYGSNTNPVIRRCRIFDSEGSGIWVKDNAKGIIEDCDIQNNVNSGILINNGSNPIIRECRIFNGKEHGILIINTIQGTIENCDVYNNDAPGIVIGNESNFTIHKCRIFDGKQDGICVVGNSQGTIENCDIYNNNFSGIFVYDGSNPIIGECRIFDGKHNGIWVTGNSQATIDDRDIYYNACLSIYVSNKSNSIIRECRIFDGKSSGIYITGNSQSVVEDCNIYQNKKVAVEIVSGSNPTIRRCRIHDGKELGIWIKETAQAHIEDCKLERIPCPGIKIDSEIQSTIHHTYLKTNKPFYLGLAAISVLPLAAAIVSHIAFNAIAMTMFVLVFYVFQKRGFDIMNISFSFVISLLLCYGLGIIMKIEEIFTIGDLFRLLFILDFGQKRVFA